MESDWTPPVGDDWIEEAPGLWNRKGPDGKILESSWSPERKQFMKFKRDEAARNRVDPDGLATALKAGLLDPEDNSPRADALRALIDAIAKAISKDDSRSLSGVEQGLRLLSAFPKPNEAPPAPRNIVLDPAAWAFIQGLWADDDQERAVLEKFAEAWRVEHPSTFR